MRKIRNYVQVGHWFFDIAPELKPAELRVLVAVLRQTAGYHKRTDSIAWSQLRKMTGLSTRGLAGGLNGLVALGLIEKSARSIPAQRITLSFENCTKFEAIRLYLVESERQEVESSRQEVESQNKSLKKSFKDNTTSEWPESLALLCGGGIDESTANSLIATARKNGRQESYITQILGYVAQQENLGNPAGLVVYLIRQNSGRKATPKTGGGHKGGINLSDYEHGGKWHKLANDNCFTCKKDKANEA